MTLKEFKSEGRFKLVQVKEYIDFIGANNLYFEKTDIVRWKCRDTHKTMAKHVAEKRLIRI